MGWWRGVDPSVHNVITMVCLTNRQSVSKQLTWKKMKEIKGILKSSGRMFVEEYCRIFPLFWSAVHKIAYYGKFSDNCRILTMPSFLDVVSIICLVKVAGFYV
jgi:hypothetical protein